MTPKINDSAWVSFWAAIHGDRIISPLEIMVFTNHPDPPGLPTEIDFVIVDPTLSLDKIVLVKMDSFAMVQTLINDLEDFKRMVYPNESEYYDGQIKNAGK